VKGWQGHLYSARPNDLTAIQQRGARRQSGRVDGKGERRTVRQKKLKPEKLKAEISDTGNIEQKETKVTKVGLILVCFAAFR
jgi:hypothetical protein